MEARLEGGHYSPKLTKRTKGIRVRLPQICKSYANSPLSLKYLSIGQLGQSKDFKNNLLSQSIDVETLQNPYKVHNKTEAMLIQREHEKRIRLQKSIVQSQQRSLSTTNESARTVMHAQDRQARYAQPKDYFEQLSFSRREGTIKQVEKLASLSNSRLEDSVRRSKNRMLNKSVILDFKNQSPRDSLDPKNRSTDDPSDRKSPDQFENVIISQLPCSMRYLSHNVFNKNSISPRENHKDLVQNTRKLLYTQLSIQNKKEETAKLKEYIVLEKEKLEEAHRTFQDDCDKFTKYISEVDQMAFKATESTEEAIKERKEQNIKLKKLQHEILNYNRQIAQEETKLKQYKHLKAFIEMVTSHRQLKVKYKESGQSEEEFQSDQFFITEDQHPQNEIKAEEELQVSKNEFREIIQTMEDQNIFLLENVQSDEIKHDRQLKLSNKRVGKIEAQLTKMNHGYKLQSKRLQDKLYNEQTFKNQISNFNGSIKGSKSQTKQSALSQAQMVILREAIYKLFKKVQPKEDRAMNLKGTGELDQLRVIEKQLDLFNETRDYIVNNSRQKETLKQLLEVEKTIDKDRKKTRYENKKKLDEDQITQKNQRIQDRLQKAELNKPTDYTRIPKARSVKPQIRIAQDKRKPQLTQEAVDYLRYVEGKSALKIQE